MDLVQLQKERTQVRNQHLAFISVFFNGNSESYLNFWHKEIYYWEHEPVQTEEIVDRIWLLKRRVEFITATIPPKIKWYKLDRR